MGSDFSGPLYAQKIYWGLEKLNACLNNSTANKKNYNIWYGLCHCLHCYESIDKSFFFLK